MADTQLQDPRARINAALRELRTSMSQVRESVVVSVMRRNKISDDNHAGGTPDKRPDDQSRTRRENQQCRACRRTPYGTPKPGSGTRTPAFALHHCGGRRGIRQSPPARRRNQNHAANPEFSGGTRANRKHTGGGQCGGFGQQRRGHVPQSGRQSTRFAERSGGAGRSGGQRGRRNPVCPAAAKPRCHGRETPTGTRSKTKFPAR